MFNRIGLVFALIGFLTLSGVVLHWIYWDHPERWNPAARRYHTHLNKLRADSTRMHRDSLKTAGLLAFKDSVITQFRDQFSEAKQLAESWKTQYLSEQAKSDAKTDALTDAQRQTAYLNALVKNGTLRPASDIARLSPADPMVISAGLKTANREASSTLLRDSLTRLAGLQEAANQRMRNGLRVVSDSLGLVSAQARQNARKGGLWPFNVKRKKQLRKVADQLDKLKTGVDRQSQLEDILNTP